MRMKEAEEGWCKGGKTDGSEPTGNHPGGCSQHELLPRVVLWL